MSQTPKSPISMRRLSRLNAVQALYQHELTDENIDYIISQFNTPVMNDYPDWNKNLKPDLDFLNELILGVKNNLIPIDQEISSHLSENWRLERLPIVTLSILRLAVYELKYEPLIPTAVIINEYIEVAKDFFGETETAFVNGILDVIARKCR